MIKNSPANAGDVGDNKFHSWVGKIPCRRKWQPTPVFLPGKFHGPWSGKELDMSEHTQLF